MAIGPRHGAEDEVLFFVAVEDVAATLKKVAIVIPARVCGHGDQPEHPEWAPRELEHTIADLEPRR